MFFENKKSDKWLLGLNDGNINHCVSCFKDVWQLIFSLTMTIMVFFPRYKIVLQKQQVVFRSRRLKKSADTYFSLYSDFEYTTLLRVGYTESIFS